MKVMLAYFDDEVLKNIFTLMSVRPDKVIFLYDQKCHKLDQIKNAVIVCKYYMKKLEWESILIRYDNIKNIYETTKRVFLENRDIVVDLTGGNELMVIGGYRAAVEMGIQVFYANIMNEKLIDVKDGESSVHELNLRFEDFVFAKGGCMAGHSQQLPYRHELDGLGYICQYIFKHLDDWKKTCSYLQILMARNSSLFFEGKPYIVNRDGKTLYPSYELLMKFQEAGLIKNYKKRKDYIVSFEVTSEVTKHYITTYGIWLELYAYMVAAKMKNYKEVLLGAIISWNASESVRESRNEIDVAFCYHGFPVCVSCKMGEVDTAAVNELVVASERLGGSFGKKILVSLSPIKEHNTGVYRRAKELGIYVLDHRDIISNNFEERFEKAVKWIK